eukprot:GFYU01008580.1.p1 GENE.GFYU01008580.1~~GFYU01008580.1.p1  ORF type:complete len:287 (-),score=91.47 GFYU01008580.1:245-1078(-)
MKTKIVTLADQTEKKLDIVSMPAKPCTDMFGKEAKSKAFVGIGKDKQNKGMFYAFYQAEDESLVELPMDQARKVFKGVNMDAAVKNDNVRPTDGGDLAGQPYLPTALYDILKEEHESYKEMQSEVAEWWRSGGQWYKRSQKPLKQQFQAIYADWLHANPKYNDFPACYQRFCAIVTRAEGLDKPSPAKLGKRKAAAEKKAAAEAKAKAKAKAAETEDGESEKKRERDSDDDGSDDEGENEGESPAKKAKVDTDASGDKEESSEGDDATPKKKSKKSK